jgi:uncharacterized protein YneF (UPF0154 family)
MFSKIILGVIGTACGLVVVGMAIGKYLENKQLKEELANAENNYIVVKGKIIAAENK